MRRDTSDEAWRSFRAVKAKLDRAILDTLNSNFEMGGRPCGRKQGCTCQEIEKKTKRTHQAVSGNLRHLVEKGLVLATRYRRKLDSGRSGIVWIAAVHYNPGIHILQ